MTAWFTSHQLCFLEPLFRLFTQGNRIAILECIQLVIVWLHISLNDVRKQAELLLEEIQKQLHIENGAVEVSANISTWADSLSKASTTIINWVKIEGITIKFLNKTYDNNNKEKLIAANIFHNLAVKFCNRALDVTLEDSFAHSTVSNIFEAVFQSEPLLSYQWANGYLMNSDKYKPDYIVFVAHSQDRYDVVISELKSSINKGSNNVTESDLVKIGKGM